MERVVATLLAELDGPGGAYGRVFVMGATNRPNLLDPSLLRPGQLDRLVYLGIPTDRKGRAQVLAAQLRRLKLKCDTLEIAKAVVDTLPARLTGADFSTIASGALLQSVKLLCRKADAEQRVDRDRNGTMVMIDRILQGWGESEIAPVVELDDLLEASKVVTPRVSQAELDRYDRLREQYNSQ
jgi:peroxin-6